MAGETGDITTFRQLLGQGVLEIGDGYRAKNAELGGDGPIFLRAGHVTDTHIDFAGVERFRSELAEKVRPKMARPGDTIITTKGNSTGRTSYVADAMPPFVYSPHLSYWRSLDHGVLVPGFLRYWAKGREFVRQLEGMKTSTDMAPYLSLTDQRRLEITLPTPAEQNAIAHVLGTLDGKIELNRRMNETLEGMARAIFKSWFIDFDPVRRNAALRAVRPVPKSPGLPAVADGLDTFFPDAFQDSPLGGIPKGWKVGAFGDVAMNLRRSIGPEEFEAGTPYIALDHMPRRSIALCDWGTVEGVASGKCAFHRGEILFGKLRPYFHKVGVAPVGGVCSTDILVVVPKSAEWFGFVLGHASSDEFVAHTDSTSTGTRMPRTSWRDMSRYEVILPPARTAQALTDQLGPLIDRIIGGIHESRSLATVRDVLLPKLVSGEIRAVHSMAKAEGVKA